MKVDIVIPNYNGISLLKKNLPDVYDIVSAYREVGKIIIVDDGSDDNQLFELKDLIKQISGKIAIELIEQKQNKGFASTVNKGVKSSAADFVFLLNTDAVPEKGFLEVLLDDFSKDEALFAIGCMDKSVEEDAIVLRGRGVGRWVRGFLMHDRGEVDSSDTLWVSGGSSILKRDFFNKVGGFDEIFDPFYWEDIDLSYRAVKSGYKILFEKRSTILHYHDEGAIRTFYSAFYIKKIAYRNQFIFVWKNITDTKLLLDHMLNIPYHFIASLIRLDIAFIAGFVLALAVLPAIIRERVKLRKLFKLSDLEILKKV